MRLQSSIAPALPDDVDVFLVLDDFGERLGRAGEECTDRDADLIEEQYSDPVRVVAFNTAERSSRDVSEDIADELARGWLSRGPRPRRLSTALLNVMAAAGLRNCLCPAIPIRSVIISDIDSPPAMPPGFVADTSRMMTRNWRRGHYLHVMPKFEFCLPTSGIAVPSGPDWFHEIKCDGYRSPPQAQ
jgi:hypothetical protein